MMPIRSKDNTTAITALRASLHAKTLIEPALLELDASHATLQRLHGVSFPYHGPDHTRNVLSQALILACEDGICTRDKELIAVAATFHDFAYASGRVGHEHRSAERCRAEMERADCYSCAEIDSVIEAIESTVVRPGAVRRLPFGNPIAPYLLDADLSAFYLCREEFMRQSDLLEVEWRCTPDGNAGAIAFRNEQQFHLDFIALAIEMSKCNPLYTAAARRRQPQKDANIAFMEAFLANPQAVHWPAPGGGPE